MDRPGDSTGQPGWHSPEESREVLTKLGCLSVGYLTLDKPEGIVISLGVGGAGQYLDSMAIPRAAITAMRKIGADD